MESAIGYLLDGFKDESITAAVILNDQQISDNPEGGTGKGIFVKALVMFLKTAKIDGKTFKFDKSFIYQRIELDTKLMAFEDVVQGFPFENMFSTITEGVEVEKKGIGAFYISYEDSPKWIFTTNYVIKGTGNSFDRRRFDLEFAQYFTGDHTPLDEFGRMLFSEWEEEDFFLFDTYMINCILKFKRRGLIKPVLVNLGMKQLIAESNEDIVNFLNSQNIPSRIIKEELKSKFDEIYPSYQKNKWYSPRKFYQWVEKYFTHYDIKHETGRSSSIARWDIENPIIRSDQPDLPDIEEEFEF